MSVDWKKHEFCIKPRLEKHVDYLSIEATTEWIKLVITNKRCHHTEVDYSGTL